MVGLLLYGANIGPTFPYENQRLHSKQRGGCGAAGNVQRGS